MIICKVKSLLIIKIQMMKQIKLFLIISGKLLKILMNNKRRILYSLFQVVFYFLKILLKIHILYFNYKIRYF